MLKKLIISLVVVVVVAGSAMGYFAITAHPIVEYRTAEVKRGDLLATITATGTLEPEEVVDVGAQVAGQIMSFGPDPKEPGKTIDYGTEVEVNSILAEIDPALFQADKRTAEANLLQAQATEQQAEANVLQSKAKLVEATNNWNRAQKVGAAPVGPLTESDFDAYRSAFETAQAAVTVSQAAISLAKAGITQADATLYRAQRNLDYCTIKSPVKGKIIDRRVNVGQTVVSSLNAPSLFLIAKDLTKIQVWSSVNEADVGNVHSGQNVTFTVDAFSGQNFHGKVGKVRLNAQMTQNVVTYTVEINTDNEDGRLLPYMTANVQFEVDRSQNVMLVPNAALRWFPQQQEIAPEFREQYAAKGGTGGGGGGGGGGRGDGAATAGGGPAADMGGSQGRRGQAGGEGRGGNPADPSAPRRQRGGAKAAYELGTVWVDDHNGYVKPVKVKTGHSDGVMTQLFGDDLKEKDELVIGEKHADEPGAAGGTTNPFMPQIFSRRRG